MNLYHRHVVSFKKLPEYAGYDLQEFLHDGNCKTANKESFVAFLDAVRKKRPEKMEKEQLVYPPRQCSSTPVGFGQ
jgi:hypothetical protein